MTGLLSEMIAALEGGPLGPPSWDLGDCEITARFFSGKAPVADVDISLHWGDEFEVVVWDARDRFLYPGTLDELRDMLLAIAREVES